MNTLKTLLAAAALTLGGGIAFGQQPETQASDNAATPAEPATPATPADPATGTAATPADPATPATPAAKAEDAQLSEAEIRAKKRAERRARCLAIKVGKARDC